MADTTAEPSPSPASPAEWMPGLVRFAQCLVITLAGAQLLAAIIAVDSPMQSANDRSRWCTVWSLAERGTFQIDEIIQKPGWDTIDKVRYRDHFYSTKPALQSTLVAGVYWCIKKVTGWNLLANTREVAVVVLLLVNLLPWLLALGLAVRMADRLAATVLGRLVPIVALAFGTFLTTFSVTLNNHTPAAICVIITLWAALPLLRGESSGAWRYATAGFFAAFAASHEMPAALFVIAIGLCLLRKNLLKTVLAYGIGAALPTAAFLFTTYLCSGTLKPFQSQYGTEIYRYVHEGIPSYWVNPQGIDQNLDSPAVYAFNSLIGHHGIFSLTPILLLVFPGWYLGLRRRAATPDDRWLHLTGIVLTVAVLAFYLTRTENYNYGGHTSGLRWAFWLTPLWILSMIPALDAWGRHTSFRTLTLVLLAISTFSTTLPLGNPWTHPWVLKVVEHFGWVNYDSPPQTFSTRGSWLAGLPRDEGAWAEYAAFNQQGEIRVRMTAGTRTTENGEARREITWTRTANGETETETFSVYEDKLNAGAAVSECLVPGADKAQTARAAEILQGTPGVGKYGVRALKYVRIPLRKDAFATRQAVAIVSFRWQAGGPVLNHRRDVWWTDDVPFGVLQFEDLVIDKRDNSEVTRIRYRLVASQPQPAPAPTRPEE